MCFDLIPGFLSTGVKQDLRRCTDRSFPFLCCLAHLTSQKALSSNMTPEFREEYRRAKRTRMTAFSFFYLTFGVLSTIRLGYHRMGVAAGHRGRESVSTEWGWQVLGCGHSLCGQGLRGWEEGGSWAAGHFHLWKWLLSLRQQQQYFMPSMVSLTIKCQSLQPPYLLYHISIRYSKSHFFLQDKYAGGDIYSCNSILNTHGGRP